MCLKNIPLHFQEVLPNFCRINPKRMTLRYAILKLLKWKEKENFKQEHHIQSNLNIHDIFSTETIGWRRQWNSIYKMWNCQSRLSYSVKIALKIEGKKRHLQFNKPWRILKRKPALSHIIKHFVKAEEN